MRVDRYQIEVESGVLVSAVAAYPQAYTGGVTPCLILAHGAGSDMGHPFLSFVHEAQAARGILAVKFNFPYMEAGCKVPDSPQRLLQTWRALIAHVRAEANP